ncbi:MAG: hypothetical protein VYA41_06355 [Pseudomonadota bacterium]|nr:hypothetical protein [Pseudomonadota bacterium]
MSDKCAAEIRLNIIGALNLSMIQPATSAENIAPDAYRKISGELREIIRSLAIKSDACVAQIE